MNGKLEIIEGQLPWGLHDSLLVRLELQWTLACAHLDLRVPVTESQDQDRLGRLSFDGLLFCAIDSPEIDESRGYLPIANDGLQISCGEGPGRQGASLPVIPPNYVLLWFFVREWNRFIHISARSIDFCWIEDATRKRSARRKAIFPGEEV